MNRPAPIKRSNWVVGDKGVKIIMLQVQPGTDDKVYRMMSKHLEKLKSKSEIDNFCIYKAFGHHDLIVIYESEGLNSELLFEGTIPHIVDSSEIFCFSWERKGWGTFTINEKKMIGIIFFKIKPSISTLLGIEIERNVAEYIYKESQGKKITFLGSLGWNEFIILAHEDNFNEITEIIKSFTQSVIKLSEEENTGKKKEMSFALKTYSVIGTNYKNILSDKAIAQAFAGQKFGQKISILLSIICKPQDFLVLSKALKKAFNVKDVYFTIGKTDIRTLVHSDDCNDWADFVIKLRRFRSEHIGRVISTATEISFGIEDKRQEQSEKIDKVMYINLNKKEINNIRKYNLHSSEHLIKSFYVFNSLIQNDIVKESFFDLLPFMSTLRKISTKQEIKSLDKKLERLRFGIDQRLYGTFLSQEGAEARFFPYRGGIQRILLSAEVLPKIILNRVKKHWPGFLIAGFDHKYMHHDEILNLPLKLIFTPKEWWGLFHETGHVYMNLSNTINFDDKTIIKKIEDVGVVKLEWYKYTKYTKFLSELFADLFDFKVCFIEEFALYIKSVWGYLIQEINNTRQGSKKREQLADYLLRSFFVYIYNKLCENNLRNGKSLKYKEIDYMFRNDFLPLLYKLVPASEGVIKKDEQNFSYEIPLRFADVKWFLNVSYKKAARLGEETSSLKKIFHSNQLLSQIKLLEKGYIIPPDDILDPTLLILKMKERDKHQSFRSQIAAILSLWGFYNKNYVISGVSY
ncbi:MAG: hypothetical protein IEMM0008_0967 [bacterium]|nr:MAG: hypothetical protein IEMM0008_0967 [bacterium]